MTAYLTTIIAVAALAFLAGWRWGQRRATRNERLSPLAAGIALALGLFWFLAAWQARIYADTDGAGATLAEWFAHSGKWLVLLAAWVWPRLAGSGWSRWAARLGVVLVCQVMAVLLAAVALKGHTERLL